MKNILKKENRIVLIVGIFCLIFIVTIINYTFSFFAVEKTNSSIIAGEAESMKLDLTVVEKSSTNNGKLIPQLDEYITSAVIGRNGSCIDDNNNTVCQVYKITLKNSGSSSAYINGEVVIDNKDNPNLKWAILNNTDTDVLTAPVLNGDIKTPEETVLASNELFTAGQTKNYFIVVWISEKGQTQIDSGNFTGVVNFNNSEGNSDINNLITYAQIDNSGANAPAYIEGMIPVMYDSSSSKWVTADVTSSTSTYGWYDYNANKWANGVLLTQSKRESLTKDTSGNYTPGQIIGDTSSDGVLAFYVWIPRYKYKVWNIDKKMGVDTYDALNIGIDIVFEEENAITGGITCSYSYAAPLSAAGSPNEVCSDSGADGYYTHPAFTFGSEQLTGFWMGKFETSYENSMINVLPNVQAVVNYNLSNLFLFIRQMQNDDNLYGLSTDTTEVDSHMITNMEWGAVAYFAHSKYGRCTVGNPGSCQNVATNNSTGYYTGKSLGNDSGTTATVAGSYSYNETNGVMASTTGNIYGVYDMNGGANEYVAANMSSSSGSYLYNVASAGDYYNYSGNEKYLTKYAYGNSESDQTAYNRGLLGDATSEVVTTTSGYAWHSDEAYFVYNTLPWFLRGGKSGKAKKSGIFHFSNGTGDKLSYYTSRSALISFLQ